MSSGGTWYLTVVPILSAAIMHVANTSRMNKTYAELREQYGQEWISTSFGMLSISV